MRTPPATRPPRPAAQLTEYTPVRFTPDELAAIDALAVDAHAWPDGRAQPRATAVRQLVREALAARKASAPSSTDRGFGLCPTRRPPTPPGST